MEKKCSICGRILSQENFRWKNKAKGYLHSACKDCEKAKDKKYYQENSDRRVKVKMRASNAKQRNLDLVNFYKTSGCEKCGETRSYVLDFHHSNPEEKENTIAHMIKSSSYEKLLLELEKCHILCANCHREFHYLEKENNITIEDYLFEKNF